MRLTEEVISLLKGTNQSLKESSRVIFEERINFPIYPQVRESIFNNLWKAESKIQENFNEAQLWHLLNGAIEEIVLGG